MKKVYIYTDGACRSNPGPGGWGAILRYNGREKELSGGEAMTTNNRMELLGAINALEALREPCEVELCSDSKYLVDAINLGWAKSWRACAWKGGKIKNPDLWERLLSLIDVHRVTFVWIKGHNGHEFNERCDTLATAAADKYKNDIQEN
ncbi:MAG: ribonuclease HI [Eubacteriales bacterium]|nr:ribonuclease HI [Eubacteriales bacterium]